MIKMKFVKNSEIQANISYTYYVHFTKQSLDNLKLIVSSMNNLK